MEEVPRPEPKLPLPLHEVVMNTITSSGLEFLVLFHVMQEPQKLTLAVDPGLEGIKAMGVWDLWIGP
jgi:hypothetical protein